MIKTAVIGMGMGLNYHVSNIVAHPNFELLAVSDVNQEKLDLAKERYGVKGYLDPFVMMDVEKPDLVVIASPTQFHAEHAIRAMESGIDVFLEKPMAKNVSQALEIVETMKKTGRKLMVYQPHRARPDCVTVKSIMEKGSLGQIFMIKRAMSCYFVRTNWQAYKENGGGTLNNHGSHFIDQMLYISKGKAKSIHCVLQKVAATGDADDCAKVLIKTDNDIVLDIDMNMVSPLNLTPWIIHGTRGTAMHTFNDQGKPVIRVRYCDADVPLEKSVYHKTGTINDMAEDPWKIQDFEIKSEFGINFYDRCYDYFALNHEPFVPVEETLEVMKVLEKCHESAEI